MADKQDTSKQDPEQIRREIEQTRSNMGRNIDTLQTRLSPDRLKQDAATKIRAETVGRVEEFADNASETLKGTGANMFETIKQNPLPAALAAIGLGWLFMESRNSNRQRVMRGRSYYGQGYESRGRMMGNAREYDYNYPYDYPEPRGRYAEQRYYPDQPRGGMREQAGQMTDQARDKMRQAAGSVSDTASNVAGSISDTASNVASNVSDTASNVASNIGDTAGNVADAAQRGAYQAKTRFQEFMDENPLVMGGAAVALGAIIGMSLPSTPQEDQLLGQARDTVMQKAQDQAQETLDKVQHVAERAKDAAKDEAQNQKLTTS